MHVLKHTVTLPIPGYTDIEVEYNIAATGAQMELAQRQHKQYIFITDFPNWDALDHEKLGLVAVEEQEVKDEDGTVVDTILVPTDRPNPKPLPFEEHAHELPLVVSAWLMTVGHSYAAGKYIAETSSPNSKRR